MENQTKQLPYNSEAERCLLGCILIDQELQFEIAVQLKEEDFYEEKHKIIFSCIYSMLASSKPVDMITLSDEMRKKSKVKIKGVGVSELATELSKKTQLERVGGIETLAELINSIPSASNYQYYLKIVKRDSTLRKLIRSADAIVLDAQSSTDSDKSLSFAEKSIYDISEQTATSALVNANENIAGVLNTFEKIQQDKNYVVGLKTGFNMLDNLTNGLHKGNLIILAARPAVGKSTLAMNIVENVAIKENAVCAVFALEMTRDELVQRMICSVGNVSNQKATKGQLDEKEWSALWNAQKILSKTNVYIDDTSMTNVPDILSKCRRLKSSTGRLDLVVVDHMQIMNGVGQVESRQALITEISRGLKMIAKELDVPVLALSQLRRLEKGKSGEVKPTLSDLRESGSIEQDADIVMFIHRPDPLASSENVEDVHKDEAEIIIAKNRSGPCSSFKLLFKGEQTKFINIVKSYVPEPPESVGRVDNSEVFDNMPPLPPEALDFSDDYVDDTDDDIVKSVDDEIF